MRMLEFCELQGAPTTIVRVPGDVLDANRAQIERELANHFDVSSYRHPFIAQLQRVTIVPPSLALVMEKLEGMSLEQLRVSGLQDSTCGGLPAALHPVACRPGSLSSPCFALIMQENYGGSLPFGLAKSIFQQVVIAAEFCARCGKCNRE